MPKLIEISPTIATMATVTTQADPMSMRTWQIHDAEALAIIVGTTATEVLPHLKTADTSRHVPF